MSTSTTIVRLNKPQVRARLGSTTAHHPNENFGEPEIRKYEETVSHFLSEKGYIFNETEVWELAVNWPKRANENRAQVSPLRTERNGIILLVSGLEPGLDVGARECRLEVPGGFNLLETYNCLNAVQDDQLKVAEQVADILHLENDQVIKLYKKDRGTTAKDKLFWEKVKECNDLWKKQNVEALIDKIHPHVRGQFVPIDPLKEAIKGIWTSNESEYLTLYAVFLLVGKGQLEGCKGGCTLKAGAYQTYLDKVGLVTHQPPEGFRTYIRRLLDHEKRHVNAKVTIAERLRQIEAIDQQIAELQKTREKLERERSEAEEVILTPEVASAVNALSEIRRTLNLPQ